MILQKLITATYRSARKRQELHARLKAALEQRHPDNPPTDETMEIIYEALEYRPLHVHECDQSIEGQNDEIS